MPSLNVADLMKDLVDSETADKTIHAEQRSNVLLVSGEHYTKRNSKYWNRLRESRNLTQDQKLRLTKNHLQKIVKTYTNETLRYAPGVMAAPNNDKETQDVKSAELNNSVIQFGKRRYRLKQKIREWAEDFNGVGECYGKIIWNPDKGELIGYNQAVTPDGAPLYSDPNGETTTEPGIVDPLSGQVVQPFEMLEDKERPEFTGDFEFKRIFAWNIRRPCGVLSLDDAEWLCEVDMVKTDIVKQWVEDDPDKARKITEDQDSEFYVFDGDNQGYDKKKGFTQVFSRYYRKCKKYPNGYYYIHTRNVILFEGELPYGVFPICYAGFDSIQTSPRSRSIIKQLRPYQVEINRCASKIAEHQVTLGDDKLLVQSGTKLTQGINLPGVRAMQYTGREPIVVQGRSGAQYLEYMEKQIAEMYSVANIVEEMAENNREGKDAFAQLFKSMRQRKKFVVYAEKFEQFLVDIFTTYLDLSRHYYDENFLIPMIGKSEAVNISEFKQTQPLEFSIKLEPRSDDLETQYGKQLVINHALQYIGNQLEKDDIGRLMRSMPLGNFEEGFEDFTLDYDSATNLILALDRGELPEPSESDDPTYIIKRLVSRTRKPDFKQLSPQVQQAYKLFITHYQNLEVEQMRKLKAAEADFIPTDGPSVKVDVYVPTKGNPDKSERATAPIRALEWLIQRLADQGNTQERLSDLGTSEQATIAQNYLEGQGGNLG